MSEQVIFFRPYPFALGQKIHIEDGPRRGDWIVAAVDAHKVTLRCPVSGREFAWDRFCYFTEEREAEFPARDHAAMPISLTV
ncbi:MAG: hypothetical protein ACTFAL_10325 [Candidatus Electronema sp. V4]|uniref:hypothetical protein n=1 Tax=Candidatus Electronema sp. V4 TaxID=3454756 RepID=UPI0040557480